VCAIACQYGVRMVQFLLMAHSVCGRVVDHRLPSCLSLERISVSLVTQSPIRQNPRGSLMYPPCIAMHSILWIDEMFARQLPFAELCQDYGEGLCQVQKICREILRHENVVTGREIADAGEENG